MLEAIREQSKHTLVWIIFAVIIVVFIFFFGPQSQGMGPSGRRWAAKVDGVTIFEAQVTATFGRSFGNATNMDIPDVVQAKRQIALDIGMVYALAVRANEAGLYVSDEELDCYIVNWNPNYALGEEGSYVFPCEAFPSAWPEMYPNLDLRYYLNRDGSFSSSYAQDVRGTFQISIEAYEDFKRAELLALRYIDFLAAGAPISREQVLATLARRGNTVDLEYLALDPSAVENVTPTSSDVERFTTSHRDEIAAFYSANTEDFAEAAQVRVRRIYIRKPDATDETAFAEAQGRFEELLARAQGEEDFEALVREFTELEREQEEGGDMGLNPESRMATDIFEAAMASEVGVVSAVDQTYAWNIIRVEEQIQARTVPLVEATPGIAAQLAEEVALAEAREGLVTRGARILELAGTAESLDAAATAEAEEESTRINAGLTRPTPDGDGVCPDTQLVDANGQCPVDEVTISPLRVSTTGAFARETPSPLAQFRGLDPSIQIPPTPADVIPRIGSSRELMHDAFLLTDDAPLMDAPVTIDGMDYLIRLNEIGTVEEPTDEEFAAVYAELQGGFLAAMLDPNAARVRILTHQGSFPPLLQAIVDEELASGNVRIHEEIFVYVPAEGAAAVE